MSGVGVLMVWCTARHRVWLRALPVGAFGPSSIANCRKVRYLPDYLIVCLLEIPGTVQHKCRTAKHVCPSVRIDCCHCSTLLFDWHCPEAKAQTQEQSRSTVRAETDSVEPVTIYKLQIVRKERSRSYKHLSLVCWQTVKNTRFENRRHGSFFAGFCL